MENSIDKRSVLEAIVSSNIQRLLDLSKDPAYKDKPLTEVRKITIDFC